MSTKKPLPKREKSRSNTKKGPGRMHMQGTTKGWVPTGNTNPVVNPQLWY